MDDLMQVPARVRSPHVAASLAVATLVHGALLLHGSFRATYDAYVHIFLADHYARDWFSTWDTRWYTGFPVTSYPPGTHQLVAIVSQVVGLEWAFVVVQLVALLVLVSGVYRFSRLWVDEDAARWAALLAAVSPSIAEAVHVFGQLPTTASLGLLLHATPPLTRWLHRGCPRDLAVAIATLAATTACHHVTTLFGSVFFIGPLVARSLLTQLRIPAEGEPEVRLSRIHPSAIGPLVARRLNRIVPVLIRTAVLGVLVLGALVVVVLPYWLWSHADPIVQVPIPHASRDSFVDNLNAGLVFWVVPWSWMALLIPAVFLVGFRARRWPLAASALLLTVLGTGGTTPIPRLLLGGAFEILTLDRFTFWATIIALPLVGELAAAFAGWVGDLDRGPTTGRWQRAGAAVCAATLVGTSFLFAASLTRFRTFQPDPVDPAPVTEFLAKDAHDRWRYLLLGLGDQMAWVSANTTAETVDGNYHSARRLPDLVTRSIERLEGAKFRGMAGIGSLQQILTTPARYHLKFVLSNDSFYDPLLFSRGWNRTGTLRNGLVVWERGDIPPLPERRDVPLLPLWQRLLWGLLPSAMILAAITTQLLAAFGFVRGWSCRCTPAAATALGRLRAALAREAARLHRFAEPGSGSPLPAAEDPAPRSGRTISRLVLATAAVAAGATLLLADQPESDDPAAVAVSFYDHIDFGRLELAWQHLHPAHRPSLDQFLLDRSVQDGLVAGYAKLDSIDARAALDPGGTVADVSIEAEYLTSLTRYRVERSHRLIKIEDTWYILPDPPQQSVPTDQLVRQVTVDYLDLGRRRPTTGATRLDDVLDRPRVKVVDARAVLRDDQWHLVGQLTNVDIDPAEITVTGELLTVDGDSLARQGAGPASVARVLPGETVPFRVDFDRLLTREDDPSFDPTVAEALQPDEPVASFRVEVQALVTDDDLTRLPVSQLRLRDSALEATLHNPTPHTATLPFVWVAQHDDQGRVSWVDVEVVGRGVSRQHTGSVRFELTDRAELGFPAVEGQWFDTADAVDQPFPPDPLELDGRDLTIVASAFRRDP